MSPFPASITVLLAAGAAMSSCASATTGVDALPRASTDIAQRPEVVGSRFFVCAPCEQRTPKTLATFSPRVPAPGSTAPSSTASTPVTPGRASAPGASQ
jgi:hypothetical protein